MALSLFNKSSLIFKRSSKGFYKKPLQNKLFVRSFADQTSVEKKSTGLPSKPKHPKVAEILERLRKIQEDVSKQTLNETHEGGVYDATIILKPDPPAEPEVLGEEHKDKSVSEQFELKLKIKQERIMRFRQAIIDRLKEKDIPVPIDLSPDEIPEGPLHLKGHFGTPERPMLVPSDFEDRIVGCQGGGGPKHHEVLWHVLKKTKPLACMECGQVFRLVSYHEWIDWAAQQWEQGQDTVQFFIPEN